jgi:TusA-related sulfurtransferase
MTFVKTKIQLAKISKDDILEVLVTEGEPLDNIPKSVTEQGFEVLGIENLHDNIFKIRIRK